MLCYNLVDDAAFRETWQMGNARQTSTQMWLQSWNDVEVTRCEVGNGFVCQNTRMVQLGTLPDMAIYTTVRERLVIYWVSDYQLLKGSLFHDASQLLDTRTVTYVLNGCQATKERRYGLCSLRWKPSRIVYQSGQEMDREDWMKESYCTKRCISSPRGVFASVIFQFQSVRVPLLCITT
jgi:hypothetical protein